MLIMLKEPKDTKVFNEILKDKGLGNFFLEEENLNDWLEDINTNPESPQKHLKPAGRDLAMKELKQIFKGSWTTVGMLDADIYFGRTSVCDMQKLANFIVRFADDIEYVKGSDVLIERGELTHLSTEEIWKIKGLEKEEEELIPYSEEEKARQNELQSGLFLCKGYGDERFWTVYGRVDSVTFLQKLEWKNGHNGLYRSKDGKAFMLLPLYDFTNGFFERVYEKACEVGLMEHPTFFIAYHYDAEFNEVSAAKSFAESYSREELEERFRVLLEEANQNRKNNEKIVDVQKRKGKWEMSFTREVYMKSNKVALMRAFFNSLRIVEKENFEEYINQLMAS